MDVMTFTDEEMQEHANHLFGNIVGQLNRKGFIPSETAHVILQNYGVVLVRKGTFRKILDGLFNPNSTKDSLMYRVVKLTPDDVRA